MSKRFEWLFNFLGSKQLFLSLLVLLCLILVPRTFTKTTDIQVSSVHRVILGMMALNLILCTVQKLRVLSRSILVLHLGIILTLAGTVVSSFGYVATVNIYEGTSVDTAYRWDTKRDIPLGVNLMVRKIAMDYYPVDIKVGVLKGTERDGLFILKTGESFKLGQYTVKADSIEFPSENLFLSVFDGKQFIGSADTEGGRNLPQDFPYDFRLVAYKNPRLKRVLLNLLISRGSEVVAEGNSEVNSPLTWGNLSFYNTKVDTDQYGLPFAGIQITKDPGKPYVYAGFTVMGIGSGMYLMRRLFGYR